MKTLNNYFFVTKTYSMVVCKYTKPLSKNEGREIIFALSTAVDFTCLICWLTLAWTIPNTGLWC